MFRKILTLFLFVLFAGLPLETVQAADDAALFTVKAVKVDVTAKNAAAAREQALAQAQVKAFRQLTDRLLSDGEKDSFQMPDAITIGSLIKDYEIDNEQLSDVRYVADMTFRFKQGAVRRYMSNSGVRYTDVASKPLIIIPLYQNGFKTVLWEGQNPWKEAWHTTQVGRGAVPIVVPIGDIADMDDITGETALNANLEKLGRMMKRYGADDVVLAIAIPKEPRDMDTASNMEVYLYRMTDGIPQHFKTMDIPSAGRDNMAEVFASGVRKVSKAIQSEWKGMTTVDPTFFNDLSVQVNFKGFPEWVAIQRKLRKLDGVLEYDIQKVSPAKALINMNFKGTEARLRLALSQNDLSLSSPRVSFGQNAFYGTPLLYELSLSGRRY